MDLPVNKIMKHQKKVHFTRSAKAKSFNNRKNNVCHRFCRSNTFKNSLKLSRNKKQEEVSNFINSCSTENIVFNEGYNHWENSLKINKCKGQVNNSANEVQSYLGDFTR